MGGDIREYEADGLVVTWEPARCAHAAECVQGLPLVFDRARRPWIEATNAPPEAVVTVIDRCPSYALGYRTADGRSRVAPSTANESPASS